MRRHKLLGVFAASLFVLSGCAFTDINMKLPMDVEGTPAQVGHGRKIIVVVPFADSRGEHSDRCGMQKNGYNMDTADATCDQSATRWIAQILAAELGHAGFDVSISDNSALAGESKSLVIPVLEGSLVKLFVEPVIGFWSGSLEADLHVRLRLRRPDGLDAERNFFQKGVRSGAMMSITPLYESALGRATNEISQDMVNAVAALLDQYPTNGATNLMRRSSR